MRQNEKEAVVKLVRHIQELQRRLAKPRCENATDEEVLKLFELLWEWTPTPCQPLPRKHVIESLVGLMRGCQPREYCYISSGDVVRIIRDAARSPHTGRLLPVFINSRAGNMTDTEFYRDGMWNYRETEFVNLLWNMHCNPQLFKE